MDTQTPESTPRARRVRIPINKEGLTVGGMRFSVRRLIGFGLVLLMFILMLCPWYTFNAGENGGAFLNSLGLNGLGRLGDGESLEITSRFGPFSGINKLCLDMANDAGAPLVIGNAIDYVNRMASSQGYGKLDHAVAWKPVYDNWQKK